MGAPQHDAFQQPEPCLGRRGTRTDCDPDGNCYSRVACATFGYCRVRAVHGGSPDAGTRAAWVADAARRAEEDKQQYLDGLVVGEAIRDAVMVPTDQQRIELLKLMHDLRRPDESPGACVLRALRALAAAGK